MPCHENLTAQQFRLLINNAIVGEEHRTLLLHFSDCQHLLNFSPGRLAKVLVAFVLPSAMARLRFFLPSANDLAVLFQWPLAKEHRTDKVEVPYIGEPIGHVYPGQLHKGMNVQILDTAGCWSSFWIAGIFWNDTSGSEPLLLLSRTGGPSDYSISVILPDCDYSSQGSQRNYYIHWFHDLGKMSCIASKRHCFAPDTSRQFTFLDTCNGSSSSSGMHHDPDAVSASHQLP